MAIVIEDLKKEVEEQVYAFSHLPAYSKMFPSQEKIVSQILKDNRLMSLYGRTDIEEIINDYTIKVSEIQKLINSYQNSDVDNILNTLEYIRFMSSYDNYAISSEHSIVAKLSQSSISQVFLGKGVCASQAKLMRDIVTGLDTDCLIVDFRDKDEPMMVDELHEVTIIKLREKLYYVDPTWYNGKLDSLIGSKKIACYGKYEFETLDVTEDEILKARSEISSKLIDLLKIDQISSIIIRPEMTDIEKHCAIFSFIESRLNQEDIPVDFSNANIEGYNIEVGKLMELFFIQNEIPYRLNGTKEKSKTVYSVNLNNEEVYLYPPFMFDSKKKKLLQALHYVQDGNQLDYINRRTPELTQKYINAVYNGRAVANSVYEDEVLISETTTPKSK